MFRRHILSPPSGLKWERYIFIAVRISQLSVSILQVKFQVLTVASMKTAVFRDALCNLAPSSRVIALMMEAISISETSVNSYQITRCKIPEDCNLPSQDIKYIPNALFATLHCLLYSFVADLLVQSFFHYWGIYYTPDSYNFSCISLNINDIKKCKINIFQMPMTSMFCVT
jgi:hypothetical protein